jgi:hypothetical protein
MKFTSFALLAVAGAVVDARHLKGKKNAEKEEKLGKKGNNAAMPPPAIQQKRAIQANEDYQKHYLVRFETV